MQACQWHVQNANLKSRFRVRVSLPVPMHPMGGTRGHGAWISHGRPGEGPAHADSEFGASACTRGKGACPVDSAAQRLRARCACALPAASLSRWIRVRCVHTVSYRALRRALNLPSTPAFTAPGAQLAHEGGGLGSCRHGAIG